MKQDNLFSHDDLPALLHGTNLFENFSPESVQGMAAKMEGVALEAGESLLRRGDPGTALYIVIKGRLKAFIFQENGEERLLEEISPGMTIGIMQVLEGGNYRANISALNETELLKLNKKDFVELVNKFPEMIELMAKIVLQRLKNNRVRAALSRYLGPIDQEQFREIQAQLEWITLQRGETLYRQGDRPGGVYIVISGRLKSFIEDDDGKPSFEVEIKSGEFAGEMETYLEKERKTNVYAARESYLVKISRDALLNLIEQYPGSMKKVADILMRRQEDIIDTVRKHKEFRGKNNTLKNITVMSDNPDVPLEEFATRLVSALSFFGSTLHLSSERLEALMGSPGIAQTPDSIRVNSLLAEIENEYDYIVYEADVTLSPWTRRSIHHADRVLVTAWFGSDHARGTIEKELLYPEGGIVTPEQTLVLLHPDGSRDPVGTKQWLAERRVEMHHHIRWDNDGDIRRLSRFLAGRAIGVALSGGGARGFAHGGVLRAFTEAGIPVDMIGGVSSGAIATLAHAYCWSYEKFIDFSKKEFIETKLSKEFTLPIMSLLRGRLLERAIKKACGDRCIEDLWINCFCLSCNLTTTEMIVYRDGMARKALRATMAMPVVLEPVIENNNILVDGGVLNNLPGDIMRDFCPGLLAALDVSIDDNFVYKEKSLPSPWRVLLSRLVPFMKKIEVPTIADVLTRSISISSISKIRMVKNDADIYFNPPVEHFNHLNPSYAEEIAEAGYLYAREKALEWKKELVSRGVLP
ncbi:MAG: cyclic nucleotide-binding domain-containing protein [bacterium]|nr:cyclic nucleotide-binding domain-containing protein [bacterium]